MLFADKKVKEDKKKQQAAPAPAPAASKGSAGKQWIDLTPFGYCFCALDCGWAWVSSSFDVCRLDYGKYVNAILRLSYIYIYIYTPTVS